MTRSAGVHVSDALNCPGLRVLGKRFMALLFRASRLNGRDPGLWPQSRPPRASSFELGRQRMADGLEQSLGNLNLIWPTVVREGVWGWLQPLNPPPWKSDVPAQASAKVPHGYATFRAHRTSTPNSCHRKLPSRQPAEPSA
jgi:hypothetical protein